MRIGVGRVPDIERYITPTVVMCNAGEDVTLDDEALVRDHYLSLFFFKLAQKKGKSYVLHKNGSISLCDGRLTLS